MPVLLLANGEPLTDRDGRPLNTCTGQTVLDDTFGEAIVRGTVPLEVEGLHVKIDWIGTNQADKPKSRDAKHMRAKFPSGRRWDDEPDAYWRRLRVRRGV